MEKLGIRCKQLMLKEIKQRFEDSGSIFITSFGALGVSEQDSLRSKLRKTNACLFVVKNRIAKRVLKQLKFDALVPMFQGLIALALGGRDALSVSKVLADFARTNENFKILGAYVDEQILDLNSVKRLAAIPSKEVVLAQIVWAINSPIQGLVNTLSATIRNFVVVLTEVEKKLKGGENG